MKPTLTLVLFGILLNSNAWAQNIKDSLKKIQLRELIIQEKYSPSGMGHLGANNGQIIYSGKKTEVLILDSLIANKGQNNPREVLGRIPGANFSETAGGGFPSNGVGLRGLNPTQSTEINVRQNGYNIASDLYGYPESYYSPPLQAVERIEVIRGASSLAFGPQFGGSINYILKKANRLNAFDTKVEQSLGINNGRGFLNSFASIGFKKESLGFYGFLQNQVSGGSRPNADYNQVTGYISLEYLIRKKLRLGIEYTLFRNQVHMPGGLSDAQFLTHPDASYRSRNWLESPWNLLAFSFEYPISKNIMISNKTVLNVSSRSLVWKNEDGGPESMDTLNLSTHQFENREVGREFFRNVSAETRIGYRYHLGKYESYLAGGFRFFSGNMLREGGGLGTTGTDFDLRLVDPRYEYRLNFHTLNFAPFLENSFRLSKNFTITPGVRFEFLNSTIMGYTPSVSYTSDTLQNISSNNSSNSNADNSSLESNGSKNRGFVLLGIGFEYTFNQGKNLYGNISQAYRPIDYASLTPLGSIATVDPRLKDSKGYNADIGFRGSIRNYLKFDLGVFLLFYGRKIGLLEKNNQLPYITNIGDSRNLGLESYLEFSPLKLFRNTSQAFSLNLFNSFAYTYARYISGTYQRNEVEYAPSFINRSGISVGYKKLKLNVLESYTSRSFGDAGNTKTSTEDAVVGIIPKFWVMDISGQVSLKTLTLKGSINNLLDRSYFTLRTPEYPGPGIIPSQKRSFVFSLSKTW